MIHVKIIQQSLVSVMLRQRSALNVGISAITRALPDNIDIFSGPYSVTPAVDAQTLNTAEKYMRNDVQIHPIPYYEVSNPQNGKTVIIGG